MNLHTDFRGHKNPPPVHMGIELHAFLRDFPQLRQGKYLEAAAVRQNGTVPAHEAVKPPLTADHALSGAYMKMIGVAQLHLAVELLQIIGRDAALDGGGRAHVHKGGRLNGSVNRYEFCSPGAALLFDQPIHE